MAQWGQKNNIYGSKNLKMKRKMKCKKNIEIPTAELWQKSNVESSLELKLWIQKDKIFTCFFYSFEMLFSPLHRYGSHNERIGIENEYSRSEPGKWNLW